MPTPWRARGSSPSGPSTSTAGMTAAKSKPPAAHAPHRKRNHREGVLRLTDIKTELFFVTLDKSDGGFSPTTSYRDYAISRDHFHWETQNSAAEDTPTGRRYLQQPG